MAYQIINLDSLISHGSGLCPHVCFVFLICPGWFLRCTLLVSFCYIISALHYRIRWWFILSKLSWWFWFCLLGFMVPLVWHFSNQSLCPLVCCTCTTYVVWSTISRKCFPKSFCFKFPNYILLIMVVDLGF